MGVVPESVRSRRRGEIELTEQAQPGGQPPRTASEILSAAETLAEEIRGRADADADAIRTRAGSESAAARSAIRERLRRLSELADGMREQLGEIRTELEELSGLLARDRGSVGQPDGAVDVPLGAARPDASVPALPAAGVDDAGARLIALNLALSDTPRDEAARQLRDQVPDPERLVDEVYASVDR
jgi:hypothetical protein